MQQEQFLNREQAQKILDTRPKGTDVNSALESLAKQGFKIEGYNDKSISEQAVGVGKDILGMLTKSPENMVRTATAPVIAGAKSLLGGESFQDEYKGILNKYADPNTPSVTNIISGGQEQATGRNLQSEKMQAVGDVLQTVPVVKGASLAKGILGAVGENVAGKFAATVLPAYMLDVGMGLSDGESATQSLKPGLATTIGAVPGLVPLAQGVGRVAQKTGQNITGSVLPIGEQEAGIIKSYLANKPFVQRVSSILSGTDKAPVTSGSTAVGQGLFGTKKMIGIQAERAQQTLWNKIIQPALDNSKKQISLPEYFNTIEKKIIEETPEMTRQKALLEALDSFKEDYAGVNTISLSKLQKLKEGWAEFVPEKYYKGQNIAGNARQVSALLADEARTSIYNILGPEIRQAYFDYGNLMGLSKMGQTSMTGQKLKGGTGGLISEVLSRAVTPIGTIGGNVIYQVGKGLEFVGNAGAKTLDEVLGIKGNQVLTQPAKTQASQSTANATKNVIMKDTIPQTKKVASGKVTDINIYKKAFLDSASADAFPDIAQKVKDAKTVEEVISAVSEGGNTSMSAYVSKLNDTIKNMDKSTTGKMSGFAQITKDIPKELQPLAEEARKYKSAEEFVKNNGITEKNVKDYSEKYDLPMLSKNLDAVGKNKINENLTFYKSNTKLNFTDNHFPNEKNIIAHTRSYDDWKWNVGATKKIPNKRYIVEIQSPAFGNSYNSSVLPQNIAKNKKTWVEGVLSTEFKKAKEAGIETVYIPTGETAVTIQKSHVDPFFGRISNESLMQKEVAKQKNKPVFNFYEDIGEMSDGLYTDKKGVTWYKFDLWNKTNTNTKPGFADLGFLPKAAIGTAVGTGALKAGVEYKKSKNK